MFIDFFVKYETKCVYNVRIMFISICLLPFTEIFIIALFWRLILINIYYFHKLLLKILIAFIIV